MSMREEFEAWALKNYVIPAMENPIERASIGDGYRFGNINAAWNGWKSSRELLLIDLHKEFKDDTGKPFGELLTLIANAILEDCRKAIEAAGLKVKP